MQGQEWNSWEGTGSAETETAGAAAGDGGTTEEFQENIAQLTEKLEKERENLLREMNMMLEHKLKVSQAVALVVLDGHYHGT